MFTVGYYIIAFGVEEFGLLGGHHAGPGAVIAVSFGTFVNQGHIDYTLVHVAFGEVSAVCITDSGRCIFYPCFEGFGACGERASPTENTLGEAFCAKELACEKVAGCKSYGYLLRGQFY